MVISLSIRPPRRRPNTTGSRTAPKPFLIDSQWVLIKDLLRDPPKSKHAWKAFSRFYGQALDGKIYQNDIPVLQLVGGDCRSEPQQASGKKRDDGC